MLATLRDSAVPRHNPGVQVAVLQYGAVGPAEAVLVRYPNPAVYVDCRIEVDGFTVTLYFNFDAIPRLQGPISDVVVSHGYTVLK